MKLPKYYLFMLALTLPTFVNAQSKTTENLHARNKEALALFFYNNTLRMLNQSESKEYDELIKDIEKMKFLLIDKEKSKFAPSDYKKLVGEYKGEKFEEIMTSRHQGKSFDVMLKEKNGKTDGMLVLVNDDTQLFVLDIVGSIDLNNVTKLYSLLDESSDVGKKIKGFMGDNDSDDNKDNH